jgi:uncharacterized protein YdaU (DUF1376 family)
MSRAWMPFYVGDYLRDTMHLTPMQHGMYILLIFHYWEHGRLPDTTAGRSRVARCPWTTFRDHELTLAAFFDQPGWRHKRIDKELAKLENLSVKRRLAGSKTTFRAAAPKVKYHQQLITLGVTDLRNVTGNCIHNHTERKKEVADEERGLTQTERDALHALGRNGRAAG